MADRHDRKTRSYNMSRIRSKDTGPEMVVRRFLHRQGFRYKLHDKTLPGKPDIVLPKYRTVIFVHGCFWHGHEGCRYYVVPKTRNEWWLNKINHNKLKDDIVMDSLTSQGWRVIVIWECSTKGQMNHEHLIGVAKAISEVR